MTENSDSITAVLATIPDPSGAGDIVSAGRASAPRVAARVPTIVLDVTGLEAAQQQSLERQVRERLAGELGIPEVRIALTADKVTRLLIAVGSGKGGVGKSTVAANLAVALARAGRKVGLVDADIYGPSQPRIMGNETKPEAVDKRIVPLEAHGVRMLSVGQLVEPGTALAWRGPMASNALGQLVDGAWGDTELLIVDLPPGTGDVQLSLMQKWKPAGALIVSTPQDLSLIDARRAIDLFRKLDVPLIGLVENMSGYVCPHCGELSDPFGSGGAEAAAEALDIPFLGRIPLRPSIREASDAGVPPAAGDGEEAELFGRIAARMMEEVNRSGR
jgi:ATP-binding protein involved in chromosome partitioning